MNRSCQYGYLRIACLSKSGIRSAIVQGTVGLSFHGHKIVVYWDCDVSIGVDGSLDWYFDIVVEERDYREEGFYRSSNAKVDFLLLGTTCFIRSELRKDCSFVDCIDTFLRR